MDDKDFAPDPESSRPEPDAPEPKSHFFMGEELKPFSIRRQIAAQAMGNRLLCGRARLEAGGAYDGLFADAVALIYLCRCPEAEVKLAATRPEEIVSRSLEWAEKAGIRFGSRAFEEACGVYADIVRELGDSRFEIEEESGGHPAKNAGGGLPTAA